jgi:hypothetical protein
LWLLDKESICVLIFWFLLSLRKEKNDQDLDDKMFWWIGLVKAYAWNLWLLLGFWVTVGRNGDWIHKELPRNRELEDNNKANIAFGDPFGLRFWIWVLSSGYDWNEQESTLFLIEDMKYSTCHGFAVTMKNLIIGWRGRTPPFSPLIRPIGSRRISCNFSKRHIDSLWYFEWEPSVPHNVLWRNCFIAQDFVTVEWNIWKKMTVRDVNIHFFAFLAVNSIQFPFPFLWSLCLSLSFVSFFEIEMRRLVYRSQLKLTVIK